MFKNVLLYFIVFIYVLINDFIMLIFKELDIRYIIYFLYIKYVYILKLEFLNDKSMYLKFFNLFKVEKRMIWEEYLLKGRF